MTYDVIIIGAGPSGIFAAHHLTQFGFKVLLLDAQSSIGGGVKTIYSAEGYPVDIGAMYLHGPGIEKPNPIATLANALQVKTCKVDALNADTFDTQGKRCDVAKIHDNLLPLYRAATMRIQEAKLGGKNPLPCLPDILDYHPENIPKIDTDAYWARKFITASLIKHTGAKLSNISLVNLPGHGDYFGNHAVFPGGYQQILEKLHQASMATQNLKTILNTVVVRVQQEVPDKTLTVVTANNEHYHAGAVLCALPLAVLKRQEIQFFPALSKEKQNAFAGCSIGHHHRVIMEFDKVFWPKDKHFLYPNDPNINTWPEYLNLYAISQRKASILTVDFYGPDAQFDNQTDAEILAAALQPLQRVYPEAREPSWFHITRNNKASFAAGSGMYYNLQASRETPAHLNAADHAGRYFTGSYAQAGSENTVEGAYDHSFWTSINIKVYLENKNRLLHTQRRF